MRDAEEKAEKAAKAGEASSASDGKLEAKRLETENRLHELEKEATDTRATAMEAMEAEEIAEKKAEELFLRLSAAKEETQFSCEKVQKFMLSDDADEEFRCVKSPNALYSMKDNVTLYDCTYKVTEREILNLFKKIDCRSDELLGEPGLTTMCEGLQNAFLMFENLKDDNGNKY